MERWFCETVKEMTRMEVLLQDKESVNLSILWILCSFTFFLSLWLPLLLCCHFAGHILSLLSLKHSCVQDSDSNCLLLSDRQEEEKSERKWMIWRKERRNKCLKVLRVFFFLVVGRPFSSLWRDQHIWREHWTPYYVALVIFVVLSFLALKTWVFGDNIEKLTERTHLEKEAHRSACVYVPEKEEPRPWSSEKKREEEQYSMLFQWWFTSRSLVSS